MSINDFKDTDDNKWCNTKYNQWRGIWSPSDSSGKSPPPHKEIGIGTSVSSGDYGRKPYISKNYPEMLKRPTVSAIQNQLKTIYGKFEPRSEFEKPYMVDNYEEMQHYQPPPPGFTNFAWPDWSWPEFSGPIPDIMPAESECTHCVITASDKICRDTCGEDCHGDCHVSIACFKGSIISGQHGQQYIWNVTGSPLDHIDYYKTAICSFKINSGRSGGSGNCIEIYPDWYSIESDGDWKTAEYWITLIDGLGHICRDRIEIKCPSCVCEETANIAYSDSSDDTIDRDGTATIVVTDGCAPFSWSVSGTGFSMPGSTEGRTNTLSADDTACGSASITVTDKCGDSCIGYVRGTEGRWDILVNWSTGGTPHICGPGEVTKYFGSMKMQYLCTSNFTNNCRVDYLVTGPVTGQSVVFNGSDCGDECYWHAGYPAGWYCSGCCHLWSGAAWEWVCK